MSCTRSTPSGRSSCAKLVANAADATDRRRFESLTNPALALAGDPAIRITPDKPGRTLTIADDGIGMSRDELAQNLGTIAKSGTRAFTANLEGVTAEERPAPDRAVRRRLLCRLHGGGPGGGHLAARRDRRGLALGQRRAG